MYFEAVIKLSKKLFLFLLVSLYSVFIWSVTTKVNGIFYIYLYKGNEVALALKIYGKFYGIDCQAIVHVRTNSLIVI